MITYQVDQCADSRKFVEACTQQGLVKVWRFPHRLKGKDDPDVLAEVLPSRCTLLTTDREIHVRHAAHIPEIHSGILIIADTSSPHTLTTRDVMRILSAFKDRFAEWHTVSLHNVVVELTARSVEVWKVVHGAPRRVAFVCLDQPNWQAALSTALTSSAGGESTPHAS
jgi:hypothetical protein